MKRLVLLATLALSALLVGCSHKGENIETKHFEIALEGNRVLGLQIPADWELTEQDGFHYWQFNDSVVVYRSKTPTYTGDKKDECYYVNGTVARNFDEYTISIESDKKQVDTLGALLNDSLDVTRYVENYRERELEALPEYKDYPMDFTTNGLYMPLDYSEVTSDIFTSCHSMNGSSFVTCWIMNYKFDDLLPMLNNLVTCNSGNSKLSAWYQSDDMYYAEAGSLVVAAKKLTYNKWCCYLASNDSYADYVIKALYKVTLAE